MITSVHNLQIKWVRSLQTDSRSRHQEKTFVVEGVRLAEEALNARWQARLILYTDDLGERGSAVLEGFMNSGARCEQVTSQVMRAASDTETPQGILLALEWQDLPLPDRLDFAFIPDSVRDPGNLGTMLRTALAAGAQAVFVPPGTVDPFSPKVVRGGMGSHFRLPINALGWKEIREKLKRLRIYLAAVDEGMNYTEADFTAPMALIVGGEAEGASEQAEKLATDRIRIPMPGGFESLNAAVAAGILLFEAARQRSQR